MSDQSIQLPKKQESWFEQASNWIHKELEHQDIYVTDQIEQPDLDLLSSVLCVTSTVGDIYFKACGPGFTHEPALTDSLWRWRPDCMPPVLAIDVQRGWMLTPDLGTSLRSIIQQGGDLFARLKVARDKIEDQSQAAVRDLVEGTRGAIEDRQRRIDNAVKDTFTQMTHYAELHARLDGMDRRFDDLERMLTSVLVALGQEVVLEAPAQADLDEGAPLAHSDPEEETLSKV